MLRTTKIISPFIKDYLLSRGYSDESCVEPAGSAGSGRLYYRIKEYKKSSILQVNAIANEDFKNFVSFGKYFHSVDLPVPRIYAVDEQAAQVLMEDLGKRSLFDYTLPEEPLSGNVRILYQDVIQALIKFQESSSSVFMARPDLGARKFDYASLKWETDYFTTNYLKRIANVDDIPSYVQDFFSTLACSVDTHQKVLMHRDFQSQNIMIRPNSEIAFVDFQGARRGSMYYDLASLLFDPYTSLPLFLIIDFFEFWRTQYRECSNFSKEESWVSFLEAALQRIMQALGAYGFLSKEKGLTSFEKFINPAKARLIEILDLYQDVAPDIHQQARLFLKEKLRP